MKLAISSTGPELLNLVDPRFGRCRYYIIVNSETMEFSAIENTGRHMQWITRGTATGNLVAGQDVDVVITGHIGRKSTGILRNAGIKLYLGAKGTVKEVIAFFKEGKLEKA